MPVGASSRPRASESQLSTLGRDVVREAGISELEDFTANVNDPAKAALFHSRQDLLQ
jgi:hypothetical protein